MPEDNSTTKKKKELTVKIMKEKRTVPDEVKDIVKSFTKIKKAIKSCLEEDPKNIPQITAETKLPIGTVTYYVMSLQKFCEIVVAGEDDDDYFLYELPKKN